MKKIYKHMPPWYATLQYVGDSYRNILDVNDFVIAKEVPADAASLIVAAPEIYHALIRAHDCINALCKDGKLSLDQWPDNPVGPTGILDQCAVAINKVRRTML